MLAEGAPQSWTVAGDGSTETGLGEWPAKKRIRGHDLATMSSAAGPAAARWLGRFAAHSKTIMSFAGLLLVWELCVYALDVKLYILPPPSVVLTALVTKSGTIINAAYYTAQPMLIGFGFALVIGIALALAFAVSRLFEAIVYPQIVFLQIIPKIAVAPLFMIWFGYGLTSKVLIVFLLSFFPVVISAVQAFRSIDPDVMDLGRITGAGAWRMFWKVQVPHALPTLFTGIKVAAALAATAAVVAEFVSSDRGLGYLLLDYTNRFDTPGVFAAILVLSFMGLLLYGAVELIERLTIPWHVSRRTAEGTTVAAT